MLSSKTPNFMLTRCPPSKAKIDIYIGKQNPIMSVMKAAKTPKRRHRTRRAPIPATIISNLIYRRGEKKDRS